MFSIPPISLPSSLPSASYSSEWNHRVIGHVRVLLVFESQSRDRPAKPDTPFLTWKIMWDNVRVDRRDMGEMTGGIKGGMKITKPLYIKAF